MDQPGRNAPCPCDSGKKFKNCCLARDQIAAPALPPELAALHRMDERLALAMMKFAKQRFGRRWFEESIGLYDGRANPGEGETQLFVPWLVYHRRCDGRPLVECFLEERGRRLSDAERGWLGAQQAAWLSAWEVIRVEAGTGVEVTDLLTDDRRFVHEVSGSQILASRDAVLCRVADSGGRFTFSGMHPSRLPPREAAHVVTLVRKTLRVRRGFVPVARLRDESIELELIHAWQAMAEELASRPFRPELRNTEGDPLSLTADHFDLAPGMRDEVGRRLSGLQGDESTEEEAGALRFTFTRPGNPMHKSWENTIIGSARLTAGELKLETNSTRRADELRRRIEEACEELITHRSRDQDDPYELLESSGGGDREPAPLQGPEQLQVLRAFKARHYEDWVDEGIPALGGMSPWKAVKSGRMRPKLELLLKEMENHESRLPAEERFDVARLRARLGLKL